MNKWETFLKDAGYTKETFAELDASKMAELTAEFQTKQIADINTAIEAKSNPEAVTKMIEDAIKAIPSLEDSQTVKELKATLKTQGEAITAMKNKGGQGEVISIAKQIADNKDEIKAIAGGRAGEVEIKALTNLASVTNNAQGFFLPEIGQLGVKERSLYNVLPKVSISDNNTGGVVRYRDWDAATTVRAAAMVAEGAAFPESTAKWQWYSEDLRKVGDTLPVTEEFWEDEAQAGAELEMFLTVNVNTEIDSQLITGDNTGQNLEGLLTSAPAYTAVANGIAAANLKDLVIKVKNDITRTRGSKYRPDILIVSSSTMEDLVLAKDGNNNYIFDENTGTIGGLVVVVDENMPDNKIVIGDRRYARIYEKSGVVISRGMIGTQFTEDEMTIKARKRMLLLVRTVDKTGFRSVADVDAALVTLATTPV